MNTLHLTAPGDCFWNAFLLGNGHMGQAVSFHPENGRITLSHIAFYSGEDDRPAADPQAPEAFQKARKAALAGQWDEVRLQTERFMGHKGNYGTALPVGDLIIEQQFPNGWHHYERSLDLINGVATCQFDHENGKQVQRAFCSHPDKVFCICFHDNSTDGCHVRITTEGANITSQVSAGDLIFSAQALENRHSDGKCGVKLLGRLRVETDDGQLTFENDAIHIQAAHSWRIYVVMNTDFDTELSLPQIADTNYNALLARHTADFSAFMNRVALRIPGQEPLCRMVNLGRYLLLSGAREDAPLPMSLQGVWNDNVACNIGWTCDMHLDVNTQMNYWLSGTGNLTEARKPLFRWMEERLIPHGRMTARDHYGLPGWAAEVVANAWGWAQPYWHPNLSPCPACGAWEAADYMEHYRYTGNQHFLQATALPALQEAAEFFFAYLFEHNGQLMSGPSISPENSFVTPDGKLYTAALNTPFEIASIRNLLIDLKEAYEALGLPVDSRVEKTLAHLPQTPILSDGTLAEWGHDLPAADVQHRHMSHLIDLFPYGQITPEATPELAAAAANSIQRRLDPYDNWEDTGWARSMLAFYAARLHDGRQVGFHLSEMLRILTSPNGLVMHPSTRGASSYAPVWELDGNTGFAAAVLESLLQSHGGVIRLLPALPPEWTEGEASGLLARGQVTVDLVWKHGTLQNATFTSAKTQTVCIAYRANTWTIELVARKPYQISDSNH